MAGVLDRIAGWFRRDEVREAEEAARTEDPLERERIEEDYVAGKDDVAAAEGTAAGTPVLGAGTPDRLYEEFQADEEAPGDPSP